MRGMEQGRKGEAGKCQVRERERARASNTTETGQKASRKQVQRLWYMCEIYKKRKRRERQK